MKLETLILMLLFTIVCNGQGKFLPDRKTGCQVWVAGGYNPQDSLEITWNGNCQDQKANGYGQLVWYLKGAEVSKYVGFMKNGNPEGMGRYQYMGNVVASGMFKEGVLNGKGKIEFPNSPNKLQGNFVNGEILDLDPPYLKHLERNIISHSDSTNMFENDGGSAELFYYILVPSKPVKGVIVLLPGTWDRCEYVLSSNKALCQKAYESGIAVIVASVNQHLALNQDVLDFLNNTFTHAISKYHLPADQFVIGGFSMGGLFSIRYTEFAYEDAHKTAVIPKAVYSVDGPTDLTRHFNTFQRGLDRNPAAVEPAYAIKELKKFIGGTPDEVPENYIYYSTYSHAEKNGGNARFLKNIPIRIYNDVDVAWWIKNRGADLYDMNALDQSAFINFLQKEGNKRAAFVNAFGKGYRLEGNRHPHSWSIVDAGECLSWVKKCLGL